VSPAHPIEQLTEIPAKALRASVVEACVKSTRRHFAFPLSASFLREGLELNPEAHCFADVVSNWPVQSSCLNLGSR
jgi:hypothetical protein